MKPTINVIFPLVCSRYQSLLSGDCLKHTESESDRRSLSRGNLQLSPGGAGLEDVHSLSPGRGLYQSRRIVLALSSQHLDICGAPLAELVEVRLDGLEDVAGDDSGEVRLEETVRAEAVLVSGLALDKLPDLTWQ